MGRTYKHTYNTVSTVFVCLNNLYIRYQPLMTEDCDKFELYCRKIYAEGRSTALKLKIAAEAQARKIARQSAEFNIDDNSNWLLSFAIKLVALR